MSNKGKLIFNFVLSSCVAVLHKRVALVHDTRSKDSLFMHKLCKHGINCDIKGSQKNQHDIFKNCRFLF